MSSDAAPVGRKLDRAFDIGKAVSEEWRLG